MLEGSTYPEILLDGQEPSAFVEKVRTPGVGFNGLE